MPTRINALPLAVLLLALPFTGAHAAQRAFVSSTGNDTNVGIGCTLLAQCRSFQAAHTAVDPGGEIVALDTAGYGAVSISKSVTIMANPGVVAGIAATTGNAVTIDSEGVDVILRGIAINDVGNTNAGVRMLNGSSLTLENVVVSRFSFGVQVDTAARVKVVNSTIRGNNTGLALGGGAVADVVGSHFLGNRSGSGVLVQGTAGTMTTVAITDSVASDNAVGFNVTAPAAGAYVQATCMRCTATNNSGSGFALFSNGGAVLIVAGSKAAFNGEYGFANQGGTGATAFVTRGDNLVVSNSGANIFGAMIPQAGS